MPYYGIDINLSIIIEADSDEEARERAEALEQCISVPDMPTADHVDWWPEFINDSSMQVTNLDAKKEIY